MCLRARELRECFVAARLVVVEELLTLLGMQVEEVRKSFAGSRSLQWSCGVRMLIILALSVCERVQDQG